MASSVSWPQIVGGSAVFHTLAEVGAADILATLFDTPVTGFEHAGRRRVA